MNKSNNNSLWLRMIWMLALVAGIHTAAAQDDYNPTDPPEPQVTYRIAVSLTPDGAGSVSGIGKYAEGTSVYINTSGRRGFVFKHWLKDGVEHTTERGFYYTVERANVSFVAVYDYEPSLPAEPEELLKCPLWLECSPAGACSFNQTSGTKYLADEWVTLRAYANQGFVFQGWYDSNGQQLSTSTSVNYLMLAEETTLTARYIYDPVSPGEPAQGDGQTNVDNNPEGDVTGDKTVDASDVVGLTNAFLSTSDNVKYDVNKDGTTDASDVVRIINIYLQK